MDLDNIFFSKMISRVHDFLLLYFPDGQFISLNVGNNWPTRSPDLIPLDFILCGFVENKLYTKKSQSD